jgi:uncharacterized protein YkwD
MMRGLRLGTVCLLGFAAVYIQSGTVHAGGAVVRLGTATTSSHTPRAVWARYARPRTAVPTTFSGSCTTAKTCEVLVLTWINQVRAAYKIPPLGLNVTESKGKGKCVGSFGHSTAMSASGNIWHTAPGDNPAHPTNRASFPLDICVHARAAGENVGVAGGLSQGQNLAQIMQQMMGENPDTPSGCKSLPAGETNHACNMLNPKFAAVGFGVVDGQLSGLSGPYLTMDFTG